MGKKKKVPIAAPPPAAVKSEEVKPPPSKKARIEEPPAEEWTQPTVAKETSKKEEAERMQMLVSAFSNKQLDQYEVFRRATFQKGTVRRLMQTACGITVSQNVVIAMSGMAKVLVGEVVELGCQARDTLGETGPLQPKHVREAVRKLRQQNKIVNSRHKTRRELTK